MATHTRMSKKTKVQDNERNKSMKKSSQFSPLMLLGSQIFGSGRYNEGLPSFILQGLDSEQIWQQLELRNEHKLALPSCTREVVRISSQSQKRKHNDRTKNKKKTLKKKSDVSSDMEEEEEPLDESDSGEESDDGILDSIKKRLKEDSQTNKDDDFDNLSDSDDADDLDFDFEIDKEIMKGMSDEEDEDIGNKKPKGLSGRKIPKRTSVVDDKFFKLADMEQFLESEDLKEEKKRRQENSTEDPDDDDEEDEDEDEDIDMFGDLDSEDDDTVGAKYSDFFDPPDDESNKNKEKLSKKKLAGKNANRESDDESDISDEDEEEMEEGEEEGVSDEAEEEEADSENEDGEAKEKKSKMPKSSKKVSFTDNLLQSDDEEEASEEPNAKKNKSTFELRQEQLKNKAREMEELSLKEAPWELTGETSAAKRPENSLLETVLDFQHTSRAAPVITDETTKSLEDIIKQRIRDKTFDDVERKEKPKEDAFEFKKRIVLDQEKSKVSLGELYEQEFLKQQQQDENEVKADPECEKIEKDLSKLFHQLDALSNFRYTPMKPGTEVKIIVNTPAIAMEEVAPVATADSELLAPEEVHARRKGELKADDERTSTDKKRALRQKKKDKRERKKAKETREKLVEKMKPGLGNKYSKAKALKQLEQISKQDKNVSLIKGDHKKTSSTSFFTQLQEEVQTNVKAKKVMKDRKKKVVDASKLML